MWWWRDARDARLAGGTLEQQCKAWKSVAGYAECEQPNPVTQKFTGALHIQGGQPAQAVNINNVMLRGCTLRNTEYILGLVVNTGTDTKVMQGSKEAVSRDSTIGKTMNCAPPPPAPDSATRGPMHPTPIYPYLQLASRPVPPLLPAPTRHLPPRPPTPPSPSSP